MKNYLIIFVTALITTACTSKENYVCDGRWYTEDAGSIEMQSSFVKLGNKANLDSGVYTLCKTEGNIERYSNDCSKKYEDGIATLNFDVVTKSISFDRERLKITAHLACKKAE